jgi:hypothetical protein
LSKGINMATPNFLPLDSLGDFSLLKSKDAQFIPLYPTSVIENNQWVTKYSTTPPKDWDQSESSGSIGVKIGDNIYYGTNNANILPQPVYGDKLDEEGNPVPITDPNVNAYRVRSRVNGNVFQDINLQTDKSGAVTRASNIYQSGVNKGGFGGMGGVLGDFLGDTSGMLKDLGPIPNLMLATYLGPGAGFLTQAGSQTALNLAKGQDLSDALTRGVITGGLASLPSGGAAPGSLDYGPGAYDISGHLTPDMVAGMTDYVQPGSLDSYIKSGTLGEGIPTDVPNYGPSTENLSGFESGSQGIAGLNAGVDDVMTNIGNVGQMGGSLPTTDFPLGAGVADYSGLATPETGIYPGEGVPSGVPAWDKAYASVPNATWDPTYALSGGAAGAGVNDIAAATAAGASLAGPAAAGAAGLTAADALKYAGLAALASKVLSPSNPSAGGGGGGPDQTPVGAGLSPDYKPYRYMPYAGGGIVALADGGEAKSDPMADLRNTIENQVRQQHAGMLAPDSTTKDQYEGVVKGMTDYQMNQRLGQYLTPEVLAHYKEVMPLYGNNEAMAIEHLWRQSQMLGMPQALKNAYANLQFGLGQNRQDMGDPEYAALQQKINALAPQAKEQDWQKSVQDMQPYGTGPSAVYRDPTSGAGMAVYQNPDNQNLVSSVRYFDPSGKNVEGSIFNAPDIYAAAEKYGIDLKGIETLGQQLQAKGAGYLPGQLYPTTVNSETGQPETSDHGVNFSDIAQNRMGTAYDWTQDPLASTKGPTALAQLLRARALAKRLGIKPMAEGGIGSLAMGGQSHLGDYSDGGRLLKGPGDGVSDSIPATIGNKQPARLADGEFVVPARIVSELGNGSTDAGARKLYAMMDRIQKARGKTMGKKEFAKDTKADKYLPT